MAKFSEVVVFDNRGSITLGNGSLSAPRHVPLEEKGFKARLAATVVQTTINKTIRITTTYRRSLVHHCSCQSEDLITSSPFSDHHTHTHTKMDAIKKVCSWIKLPL